MVLRAIGDSLLPGEKRLFLHLGGCYGTKSLRLEKKLAHGSTDDSDREMADSWQRSLVGACPDQYRPVRCLRNLGLSAANSFILLLPFSAGGYCGERSQENGHRQHRWRS